MEKKCEKLEKKCDTLGKKCDTLEKSVTIWSVTLWKKKCDNLRSWTVFKYRAKCPTTNPGSFGKTKILDMEKYVNFFYKFHVTDTLARSVEISGGYENVRDQNAVNRNLIYIF